MPVGSPEFIVDVSFASVHCFVLLVLLILLFVMRTSKIIRVRSYALHFACVSQMFTVIAPAVGHFNKDAQCFMQLFVTSPFSLGSVAAFLSAFFRHLVLKRLQMLRRRFMSRRAAGGTDGNTTSMMDLSTTSSEKEDDSSEEELGEADAPNQQPTEQNGTETETVDAAAPAIVLEAATPASPKTEVAKITKEVNKEKHERRRKLRQQIAKSIAIAKKFSSEWLLLIQIVATVIIVEAIHFLILGVNRNAAGLPFVSRCIASRTPIFLVDVILSIIVAITCIVFIGINLAASFKQLSTCQLREVYLHNDPFLFTLTTSLLMLFIIPFLVVLGILLIKLGMDSYWIQVAKALGGAIPTTYAAIAIPVAVAIYRQIQIWKFARRSKQAVVVSPVKENSSSELLAAQGQQQPSTSTSSNRKSMRFTKQQEEDKQKTMFTTFNPEPGVIEFLMSSKATFSMFKSFAEKEYSDENVYFYIEVKKIEKRCKKSKTIARQRIQDLWNTFLCPASPLEVNVPSPVRQGVQKTLESTEKKKRIDTPTALIASCLDASVTNLADVYRRFYASPQFRAYLKQNAVTV